MRSLPKARNISAFLLRRKWSFSGTKSIGAIHLFLMSYLILKIKFRVLIFFNLSIACGLFYHLFYFLVILFNVRKAGDYKEGYYIGVEVPKDDPESKKPFYGPNIWPASGNWVKLLDISSFKKKKCDFYFGLWSKSLPSFFLSSFAFS